MVKRKAPDSPKLSDSSDKIKSKKVIFYDIVKNFDSISFMDKEDRRLKLYFIGDTDDDLKSELRDFHTKLVNGHYGCNYSGIMGKSAKSTILCCDNIKVCCKIVVDGNNEIFGYLTIELVRSEFDKLHFYIPKLYGFMFDDLTHKLYIFMEHTGGFYSLEKYNSKIYLKMIHPLIKLCECMALLYSQNVVHGDLKPQNVLCNREAEIKLIDFGDTKLKSKIDGEEEYGTIFFCLHAGQPIDDAMLLLSPNTEKKDYDYRLLDQYSLAMTIFVFFNMGWPRHIWGNMLDWLNILSQIQNNKSIIYETLLKHNELTPGGKKMENLKKYCDFSDEKTIQSIYGPMFYGHIYDDMILLYREMRPPKHSIGGEKRQKKHKRTLKKKGKKTYRKRKTNRKKRILKKSKKKSIK